jgi:glycosyltransferase involved in cell wall biosynthesis
MIINGLRKSSKRDEHQAYSILPEVAILIAAYNEDVDNQGRELKIRLHSIIRKDKLKIYVIADGSNDKTVEIASSFDGVRVLHKYERKGKSAVYQQGHDVYQ